MAETSKNQAPRGLTPLREIPPEAKYKKGDVLVVFGELFSRGYANGIVDEAERAGLTVVRSTVGRRNADGSLRALNDEEKSQQAMPFINIPLEAGFDLEPCTQDGTSPTDQLKGVKMSEWESAELDFEKLESSRKNAVARFRKNVEAYMKELEPLIAKGANVIFAHTMAGGVPRAKIFMPTMNWVFKGTGERHLASERFWNSDMGKLCAINFEEVTAQTLKHLIELSGPLRNKIENEGGTVRYLAYGYHGTEILTNSKYEWQSYAPYLQGWAKMELEKVAEDAFKQGIKTTVYNCPEILTNSSSIFVGVEVPLYPFLNALKKEGANSTQSKEAHEKCAELLKDGTSLEQMLKFTEEVLTSPELRSVCHYDKWPEHNNLAQMDKLITSAGQLVEMHKDTKKLITFVLSEEIFRATGYLMFHDSFKLQKPVYWLGHDVLAKALVSGKTL